MTINHLVLIGGGHTNVLLMRKWLMYPKLMPEIPISIISRDTQLVYSAMFPSVISKSISLEESLIDIRSLAKKSKVAFIKEEVINIDFHFKKIFLKNLANPVFVRMTGSGSTLVAYYKSKKRCESAKKKFNSKYKNYWCISSKTI